jgi:hypothetical protein
MHMVDRPLLANSSQGIAGAARILRKSTRPRLSLRSAEYTGTNLQPPGQWEYGRLQDDSHIGQLAVTAPVDNRRQAWSAPHAGRWALVDIYRRHHLSKAQAWNPAAGPGPVLNGRGLSLRVD